MPNHGAGGRPRKPDAQKKLQGTFRKDRSSPTQPVFTGTARCPVWLSERGKSEWKRLAPQLRRLGMLTDADQAMFAAYCEAYSEWVDLTIAIGNMKATTAADNAGRLMLRPEVRQRDQAYKTMKEVATAFGFTPAARSTIRLPEPADPAESKAAAEDAFLTGGKGSLGLVK